MKKLYTFIVVCSSFLFWGGKIVAQNIAVNTSGTAAAVTNMFEVTQASTTTNTVGIFATHTGAATNAYAIWAAVTAGTNKYAIVVPSGGGYVGIGTTTPSSLLHLNQDGVTLTMGAATVNPAARSVINFTEGGSASMSLSYYGAGSGASNFLYVRDESGGIDLVTFMRGGNVGVGPNITPNTTFDVNGSVAFREGTALSLVNGANDNIAIGSSSFFRITGPTGAFSISGFGTPFDGRIITLYNTTSQVMTIVNNATSTAVNQILTLTGANIVTPAGPNVVQLQYNATAARWVLIGGQNYASAGGGGSGWLLTGNATTTPGTNYLGTSDGQDLVLKTNNQEWMRIRTTTGITTLGSEVYVGRSTIPGTNYRLYAEDGSDRDMVNFTTTGNSFATKSVLNVSSTTTGGTGGSSTKLLNLTRTGANANASHTAYGAYSSVANTGTTNTNIAGYFTSTGGSSFNVGVYGYLPTTVTAGTTYGVLGKTDGIMTSGTTTGIYGDANTASTGGTVTGAYGYADGNTGSTVRGLYAEAGTAGTSATKYAAFLENANATASTTHYGLWSQVRGAGAATNNISGYFTSTGATNNYAIIVPNGGGNVGIGTITPTSLLQVGSSALTKAAPLTTGAWLGIPAATLTDNSTAAAGTIATGTFNSFGTPTYASSNSPVTVTEASNIYIAGTPIKGTNAIMTNSIGLRIAGGGGTTATNAYGLYVDAPSGATNNYAAAFASGKVGIGTTAPNTTLDVNGSVAWREGTAIAVTTGTYSDIAIGANSFFRITGATGAFSITGLANGFDGRIVTLYNTSAQPMTIVNNATSVAANQILTLTGANITTPAGPNAVSLQYNATTARWLLIGGQNLTTSSSGALNGVQVFTANGTYVPTAGTTKIYVELIGGGGGGGGGSAQNFGIQGVVSAGGGAGAYCMKFIGTVAAGGNTIVIGAGGSGGAADGGAGRDGSAGGTTTFLDNNTATTYTVAGGSGGAGFNNTSPPTAPYAYRGGNGGVAPATGDLKCAGGAGGAGIIMVLNDPTNNEGKGIAGKGGDSHYGAGPPGRPTANATHGGYSGTAYGTGGSGVISIGLGNGGAKDSGDGASGVVIVWEYK